MTSMKLAAAAALLTLPLAFVSPPASAASAHNSQAGALGPSQNPSDSTVSSRRVKHAAKHKKAM